jgi:hypothetical protein
MRLLQWMRGCLGAPDIEPWARALRFGCVGVTLVMVAVMVEGATLRGLAVFGVGSLALAQESDIRQAIATCPDVRRSFGNLRDAPRRVDVHDLVSRCRDLEPLRRALIASAR